MVTFANLTLVKSGSRGHSAQMVTFANLTLVKSGPRGHSAHKSGSLPYLQIPSEQTKRHSGEKMYLECKSCLMYSKTANTSSSPWEHCG